MLERAAAATWGVPASACRAQRHQVTHAASGRCLGYGELAPLAAQQPVPKKAEFHLGKWFVPKAHLTVFVLEPFGHTTGLRFTASSNKIALLASVVDKPPLILARTKGFGAYACHRLSLDRMRVR